MATLDIEKLRELIAQNDLSMRKVSLKAGLGETGVKDIFRGKSKNPHIETVAALASALNVGVDDLLKDDNGGEWFGTVAMSVTPLDGGEGLATLPLRGDVRAGSWLEVDDEAETPHEQLPAPVDPRYPATAQWLSRVRGDSMNDLRRGDQCAGLFDGDLILTVDALLTRYTPVTGDLVEVERLRDDGAEHEVTLKQVEVTSHGLVLLWPRSTNPRWHKPLRLDQKDEGSVRIRGRVLQLIRNL